MKTSVPVLILGHSGTGKTSSLRNLDPTKCFLIQPTAKILPFANASKWKLYDKATKTGSVFQEDNPEVIRQIILGSTRDIIIIDDYQSIVRNEYFEKAMITGYQKYTEIGLHTQNILKAATTVPGIKRIYLMWHPDTDDSGNITVKACGKLISQNINPPGDVSICLMTHVDISAPKDAGRYGFMTETFLGNDPTKSPPGMFAPRIDNDLALVDKRIVEYFGLEEKEG